MRVTVKKWGNSASVRIPAVILEAADLKLDSEVEIREENGRIIIEPFRPKSYDLAELLEGVTPENLHDAIDFGRPIGREEF